MNKQTNKQTQEQRAWKFGNSSVLTKADPSTQYKLGGTEDGTEE